MLKDKNILVGVCGGIAAYKSADLVSRLKKKGACVKVVMTRSAQEFVAPLTFQTLSQDSVATDLLSPVPNWEVGHVSLARWADCMIIAPATANFIGKVASGVADDMLSTIIMATKAAVVFAPAMNSEMYQNRIVQDNIAYLTKMGYLFIDPVEGRLACGDIGTGKMEEPQNIVYYLETLMNSKKDLKGRSLLVTAGPTRESMDPVRFLTNASSGKMGYSIARAAAERGGNVVLVSGPTQLEPPPSVRLVRIVSAMEMYDAVMKEFPQCDVVLKAAAVSDYRPSQNFKEKIKKSEDVMTLHLDRNPDILLELGKMKGNRILVGFAAESSNIDRYAKEKMQAKNLDFIVANDITQEGAGFNSDTNIAALLDRSGKVEYLPKMSKYLLANTILDRVSLLLQRQC